MTLDSKHSKDVYQGNGSTTVFPFAFKVWNTNQITATMTDAAGVSTDVTNNSTVMLTISGGSVTYPKSGSPLPSGAKLAITRNMPFTQGINLTTASRFDPQVLEDGLDQATAERQQILEQMARAVILPPTSNESPEDVVQSIYASRDAAAASASAASTQASAAEASAQAASGKADESAASAAASAQSAANAYAASEGMAPRMDAVESKNIQQDTRLDAVEAKNTQQDTALSGKANQAMDNLTSAGSGKVANYAMPSQRTAAVSLPASTNSTAPAPAAGFIKLVGTSSAANQYIRVSNATMSIDKILWSSAAGQLLSSTIQVRKGEAVRVEYTAPTSLSVLFVFAEGAF